MAKKPSDKRLTINIDAQWSKIIRFRAGGKCEVCGSQSNVQAHHIVGRGNWRLRWETKNGIALCSKHHKFDRHQSAHLNPLWFDDWLKKYSWKRHEKEDLLQELKSLYKLKDKDKIINFEIQFDEGYYLPRPCA